MHVQSKKKATSKKTLQQPILSAGQVSLSEDVPLDSRSLSHYQPSDSLDSDESLMQYQPLNNKVEPSRSASTQYKEQKTPQATKKHDALPARLDDVLIKPNLDPALSSHLMNDEIVRRFNADLREPFTTESAARGVRIDPGKVMLVTRNNRAQLVASSSNKVALPLVTNPKDLYKKVGIYNISDSFYGAQGHYVVNVPQGQYAKAWSGTQAMILSEGTHIIDDTNFTFNARDFVAASNVHISHGNNHILRVPAGKIAKVWLNQRAMLLPSREEPYVFISSQFRLERKSATEIFEKASDKIIQHGATKRIIPYSGEVAVTYDSGRLTILSPPIEKDVLTKPFVIENASHVFDRFFPTQLQTLVLPTPSAQAERKAEGRHANEIFYESFRTSDGLAIGVKLLVTYTIPHPEVAISQIGIDGIVRHIEKLAINDMRSAIVQSTSQDFLNAKVGNIELKQDEQQQSGSGAPSAPRYEHAQDTAKEALAKHLRVCGIALQRLSIEDVTILDLQVADAMNKQAIELAKSGAQMSVVSQNRQLAEMKAKQEAAVLALNQGAENNGLIQASEAKLTAAEKNAEAEMAPLKARAKLYKESPELFELEKLRVIMQGLTEMKMCVTSAEFGAMLSGLTGRQQMGGTPSFVSGLFPPANVRLRTEETAMQAYSTQERKGARSI